MAKPSTADIENLYTDAATVGMTRAEVDELAVPHISCIGGATRLTDVRSHGELRTIRMHVSDVMSRRRATSADIDRQTVRIADGLPGTTPSAPRASRAQVDYILDLLAQRARRGDGGGFMTGPTDRVGIAAMTRAEGSTYITSLTEEY